MAKKFFRSKTKKVVAGVCGGLADYLDVDVNIMRLLFIGVTVFTALLPMMLLYIIAWIIVPLEGSSE
jgi:phage shock protein C